MKRRALICLLFVFVIALAAMLSGCSDSRLTNSEDVISSVKAVLPEAKFDRVEHSVGEKRLESNVYYFKNKGISFTVTNRQSTDCIFGYKKSGFETDYASKLKEALSKEINAALKDCRLAEFSDFYVTYTAKDYSELAFGADSLEELLTLLDDYLPLQKSKYLPMSLIFETYVNTPSGKKCLRRYTDDLPADFDKNLETELLQQAYKSISETSSQSD